MLLKKLTLQGFKSFANKSEFVFNAPITAIVGPNGSGKSNVVESIRFVLGEQSSKSLRSKSGADIPFAGSKKLPKSNRAKVSITFDNRNRVFQLTNAKNEKVSVDFDEVTISREVFSDGANTYMVNGHDVRLRDIHELIANVNIGSSGHHIISQGEADRLLNANAKDRKEMIEEALGLKVYQFRIKETEKKLEKTETHIHETKSLRREIAPHITYLKKQVEKIHEAETMRAELREKFTDYLSKQSAFLSSRTSDFETRAQGLADKRTALDAQIQELKKVLDEPVAIDLKKDLARLNEEQSQVRTQRDTVSRTVGKLEGMIEMSQQQKTPEDIVLSRKQLFSTLDEVLEQTKTAQTSDDANTIATSLQKIHETLMVFKDRYRDADSSATTADAVAELQKSLETARAELEQHDNRMQDIAEEIRNVQADIDKASHHIRSQERDYFELLNNKKDIQSQENILHVEQENFKRESERFADDTAEAQQLFGESFTYDTATDSIGDQQALRRDIERMIIKLEEMGGGSGSETIDEYNELREREEFLEKEINDLKKSGEQLREVIAELQDELSRQFTDGISKINNQFDEFFSVLFGGGKASLRTVEVTRRRRGDDENSEEETETGIDIAVSLPRKKVQDLDMLSGGERSLTSIALLFALSQVNPPPFLVLDETDAALDEANSARYGDMLEQLSQYSQLIVVTHNRETMSRADILYGVTMGSQECSQLLSVKFDEAASQFAK